jgi:hypothetical protein
MTGLDRLDRRPTAKRCARSCWTWCSRSLALGYPFALWTLDRLQEAFFEREEVYLATSTMWERVEAKGLKWRR